MNPYPQDTDRKERGIKTNEYKKVFFLLRKKYECSSVELQMESSLFRVTVGVCLCGRDGQEAGWGGGHKIPPKEVSAEPSFKM